MTTSPTTARTIRDLAASDIGPLQQIDESAHGQAWSRRTFLDDIEQPDRVHLVAETAQGLVGHAAAWLDGPSFRITNVAVADGHQGAGHATRLLLELITLAIDTTAVANMQLEVRPSNRRAQRMYSRFGFVPVGIERGFYDRSDEQGSTDAVVMAVADVCADTWRTRLAELGSAALVDRPDRDPTDGGTT